MAGNLEMEPSSRNEVVLCGRVAAEARERELPSGDCIVTGRVIVDRDAQSLKQSGQRVDTIDCVGWTLRVQRSMRAWRVGDQVEVKGSIRRRFFRTSGGPVSRVEVEVKASKKIRSAA
ncbi:MAG: single-stranded DNA-binding protein [Nocardioidaceae bacterium]|nr:single-stranded DNA-binding protein [Nocardioidaceae bacterium]